MTPAETKKLVTLVLASFPGAKRLEATRTMYMLGLSDLDKDVAWEAAQRLLRTAEFLPSVAEIRAEARKITNPETQRPAELAWEIVLRAVGRIGVHRGRPKFKDPHIEAAVKSVGWGAICNSQVREQGVYRAQFRDAYRASQAQEVERLSLPEALRAPKQLTEARDDEFTAPTAD